MKTNANLLTTQATSAIPSTALQLSVQALTSKGTWHMIYIILAVNSLVRDLKNVRKIRSNVDH